MNKYLLFTLVLIIGFNTSFGQKRKKYKTKKYNSTKVTPKVSPATDTRFANTMLLCSSKNGMPVWYMGIQNGFAFPQNFAAPSQYKLVVINDMQLADYLKAIPYNASDKHITIPLYINQQLQCKEFMIERTVTMDSALQAKYPELMSFKAFEKGNNLNEARIDCDGKGTKFMVKYNGETYFVNPVQFQGKIFYASYSQSDPNFIKRSFER